MDDATKMYELQRVDLAWGKVRRQLLETQKRLGETEGLKSARQQVAQTESELHKWRGEQHDAELESRSLASRIKSTDERMMSGAVRNPKELEALQASLDSLQRQRAQVDDNGVEALLQADEFAGQLDENRATLERIEAEWNGEQTSLRGQETKLKQNYVLLKRKREALAKEMGPSLLRQYDGMRKRRAGIAIAPLQNGVCGACHVQVPTGVASAIRGSSANLVVCPSCGRYLYSS